MRQRIFKILVFTILLGSACGMTMLGALGYDYTWTGMVQNDRSWNNPGNWDSQPTNGFLNPSQGTPAIPGDGDSVYIPKTVSVAGQMPQLTEDISNSETATLQINYTIEGTWDLNGFEAELTGIGLIIIDGSVLVNGGTLTGAPLNGSAPTIEIQQAGELDLTNGSTISGSLNIDLQGTLKLDGEETRTGQEISVTGIGTSSQITLINTSADSTPLSLLLDDSDFSTDSIKNLDVIISSNKTLDLRGATTISSKFTFFGGTLNAGANSLTTSLIAQVAGTVTSSTGNIVFSQSLEIPGKTTLTTPNRTTLTTTGTGKISLNGGIIGNTTAGNGTYQPPDVVINSPGSSLGIAPGASFGTISKALNTLEITTQGPLSLENSSNSFSRLYFQILDGGGSNSATFKTSENLTIVGKGGNNNDGPSAAGAVTIESSKDLTVSSPITTTSTGTVNIKSSKNLIVSSSITADGAVTIESSENLKVSSTIPMTSITADGAVTIESSSGDLTVSLPITTTSTGTVNIKSSKNLIVSSSITADGAVTIESSSGDLTVSSPITTTSTGTVNIKSSRNLIVSSSITADGAVTIESSSGDLTVSSPIMTFNNQSTNGYLSSGSPISLQAAENLTIKYSTAIPNRDFGSGIGNMTLKAGKDLAIDIPSTQNIFAGTSSTGQLNITAGDFLNLSRGTLISRKVILDAGETVTQEGFGEIRSYDTAANPTGAIVTVTANMVSLNGSNDFSTLEVSSVTTIEAYDINALVLGDISAAGNVIIKSNSDDLDDDGGITQSTNTSILIRTSGAEARLSAGEKGDITLKNPGNDFDKLVITTAQNATVLDANILRIGQSTVSGTLDITASGGTVMGSESISQYGALTVEGDSTFNAAAGLSINLNNDNNNFVGSVDFSVAGGNTGAAALLQDITFHNSKAITLDALKVSGILTLWGQEAVSQTGPFSGDTLKVTTTSNENIDLSTNTNAFSKISLRSFANSANGSGSISYKGSNSANVSGIQVVSPGIATNGDVTLDLSPQNAAGPSLALTQTDGSFDVPQGQTSLKVAGSITLDGTNTTPKVYNDFADLSITSNNSISISDKNSLRLVGTVTVPSGSTATITTNTDNSVDNDGGLTQDTLGSYTGDLTVNGGGGSVILDNTENNFSTISVINADETVISDATSVVLGNISATDNLTVTSNADLTDNDGGISQRAGTSITNTTTAADTTLTSTFLGDNGKVALENSGNNFMSVTGTGNDFSVRDDTGGFLIGGNMSVNGNALFQASGQTITQTEGLTFGDSTDDMFTLNSDDTVWNTNDYDLTVSGEFTGGILNPQVNTASVNAVPETISVGGNFIPKTFDSPEDSLIHLTGLAATYGDGTSDYMFNNLKIENSASADMLSKTNLQGNLNIADNGSLDGGGMAVKFTGQNDTQVTQNLELGSDVKLNNISAIVVESSGTNASTTVELTGALNLDSGELTISTENDVFDAGANDFTIETLSNNGIFRLGGSQTSQSITTDDVDSGTVEYTGDASGNVRIDSFYNLTFRGEGDTRTWNLNQSIDVNGSLTIGDMAVLDASTSNYDIVLAGDFELGARGSLEPREGTLELDGYGLDQVVRGGGTFYKLRIDESEVPETRKKVLFESGKTIVLRQGGELYVHGDSKENPVELRSTIGNNRWLIDASARDVDITLQYVEVWYSESVNSNIFYEPDFVTLKPTASDNVRWIFELAIRSQKTVDSDLNGKIDSIEFEMTLDMNGDFSRINFSVEGYDIENLELKPTNSKVIVIHLKEKLELDTGATPRVTVSNNTSLKDTTGLFDLRNDTYEVTDGAPPLIAYSLAVAGQSEVFIRFSEAIINLQDITISGENSNTLVTKDDLLENREFVFDFPRNLTVPEILNTTFELNAGKSPVTDVAKISGKPNELFDATHAVSDIVLGPTDDAVIRPTVLKNTDDSMAETPVTIFDNSQLIEPRKLFLQAHISQDVAGAISANNVYIRYDSSVQDRYRNSDGLWLPDGKGTVPANDGSSIVGLTPIMVTDANPKGPANSASAQLIEFDLDMKDPKIVGNQDVELFFWIEGTGFSKLSAAMRDSTSENWYRNVVPWRWKLRNFVRQAGGVTILNNVINPNDGMSTRLFYQIENSGMVTVQVFSASGDVVKVLQREHVPKGTHLVDWDGKNTAGRAVARGIYFIRLVGPGGIDEIRKVLVVK